MYYLFMFRSLSFVILSGNLGEPSGNLSRILSGNRFQEPFRAMDLSSCWRTLPGPFSGEPFEDRFRGTSQVQWFKVQANLRKSKLVWGVNFIERIAQKLHRIILLHFGLVTFEFDFRKTRKLIIFLVFGPSGRNHGPQNQLFLILEIPRYLTNSRKIIHHLIENMILGNMEML